MEEEGSDVFGHQMAFQTSLTFFFAKPRIWMLGSRLPFCVWWQWRINHYDFNIQRVTWGTGLLLFWPRCCKGQQKGVSYTVVENGSGFFCVWLVPRIPRKNRALEGKCVSGYEFGNSDRSYIIIKTDVIKPATQPLLQCIPSIST